MRGGSDRLDSKERHGVVHRVACALVLSRHLMATVVATGTAPDARRSVVAALAARPGNKPTLGFLFASSRLEARPY